MIYSITSSVDATMYEQYENRNTGLDEVVQIEKIISESSTNNTFNSRILTKFDLENISQSIVDGHIAPTFTAKLKLYTHQAVAIPYTYQISAYAVSQSWEMGIGRSTHNPKTKEGVSWTYRDGISAATTWQTASAAMATGTTASFVNLTNNGGATWWTASAATQTFTYETTDLALDVTDIVTSWISGSWNGGPVLSNDGFIIKRPDVQEYNGNNYGQLQFFSKETHTIYQPRLEFSWDDNSTITTGLSELDIAADVFVYVKNNRDQIHRESKERIRVVGRERYPVKTYATASENLVIKHLPTSSYWSIQDYTTGETVIDYDDSYTKISCDSAGNYFDLWMDQLESNRRYKFIIKSIGGGGKVRKIFDDDLTFKIVD
tara:strand:+ start:762 stop:1889 length:1128 start_codon:yes stop_codon:yes gene_type:complete